MKYIPCLFLFIFSASSWAIYDFKTTEPTEKERKAEESRPKLTKEQCAKSELRHLNNECMTEQEKEDFMWAIATS